MRTVVFAHGLEGHPEGKKATALRAAGLTVVAPDGRGLPLARRIEALIPAVEAHPGCVLIGSSYGGLAALVVAGLRADEVAGLLLLAPALFVREPPVDDPDALGVPAGMALVVIHGTADAIVPIGLSRALVARTPGARLIAPDDRHDLSDSLAVVVHEALLLSGSPGDSP